MKESNCWKNIQDTDQNFSASKEDSRFLLLKHLSQHV